MSEKDLPRYRVGDLVVDTGARRVTRGQEPLKLGALTFDLFLAMVETAPSIATYDVLVDQVWNGRTVSPETIAQRASMLRRALSDATKVAHYFKAVRGKGFHLLADVTVIGTRKNAAETSARAMPSIAVLPFDTMGVELDQEYFADGLVEDIITDLSHVPQLLVISRASTFTYKGSATDVRDIAMRLNVKFVLQGSVRRAGRRIRVAAQLVDGTSGRNVWSRRFDRDIGNVFEIQDDLTDEIVSALDIELVSGEQGRQRRSKYHSTVAGELLYKGMYQYYKFEQCASVAARQYFEKFIRLEPDSVLGYIWMVNVWGFALMVRWEESAIALRALRENVDKSFAIDADDAQALVGDTYYKTICEDLDGALQSVNTAIRVSPNLDDAWFARGWIYMLLGDPLESIRSLKRAMRLCPIFNTLQLGILGTAYRNAGQFENAIATFSTCLQQFPDFVYAHAGLATTYSLMGNYHLAKREVEAVLAAEPGYSIERFTTPNFYRDKTMMARSADALRQAGMPER